MLHIWWYYAIDNKNDLVDLDLLCAHIWYSCYRYLESVGSVPFPFRARGDVWVEMFIDEFSTDDWYGKAGLMIWDSLANIILSTTHSSWWRMEMSWKTSGVNAPIAVAAVIIVLPPKIEADGSRSPRLVTCSNHASKELVPLNESNIDRPRPLIFLPTSMLALLWQLTIAPRLLDSELVTSYEMAIFTTYAIHSSGSKSYYSSVFCYISPLVLTLT